jgi:hypothetical protein
MFRDWLDRVLGGGRERSLEPRPETRVIDGIPVHVINTRDDIDTERVFRRAEAVVARVAQYQPWRLAHIRRDIAGIVVQRYACRAAFFGDSKLVMLELTFMANEQFSDSQVAASFVHEGMHARLDQLSERYGVTPFAAARARHERICRRAELDWGRAVPDGARPVGASPPSIGPNRPYRRGSRIAILTDDDQASGRSPLVGDAAHGLARRTRAGHRCAHRAIRQ